MCGIKMKHSSREILAARVRLYLEIEKLTHAGMAHRLGCSKRTIGNWLYGKRLPGRYIVVALEKLFEKRGV